MLVYIVWVLLILWIVFRALYFAALPAVNRYQFLGFVFLALTMIILVWSSFAFAPIAAGHR